MTDQLSDEEISILDTVERFASEVLAPRAAEIDETETFATVHLPALAELGAMGLNLPEEWGGVGVSGPALYRAVEAIAGACGSTASMITAHYLATDSIATAATIRSARGFCRAPPRARPSAPSR